MIQLAKTAKKRHHIIRRLEILDVKFLMAWQIMINVVCTLRLCAPLTFSQHLKKMWRSYTEVGVGTSRSVCPLPIQPVKTCPGFGFPLRWLTGRSVLWNAIFFLLVLYSFTERGINCARTVPHASMRNKLLLIWALSFLPRPASLRFIRGEPVARLQKHRLTAALENEKTGIFSPPSSAPQLTESFPFN